LEPKLIPFLKNLFSQKSVFSKICFLKNPLFEVFMPHSPVAHLAHHAKIAALLAHPVIVHAPAASPVLVAAGAVLAAPWWYPIALGAGTAILVGWVMAYVKSLLDAPKTAAEISAIHEKIESDSREDMRALLATIAKRYEIVSAQYQDILTKFHTIIIANSEMEVKTKVQSLEIEKLRADVLVLQTENASLRSKLEHMTGLDAEVTLLRTKITEIKSEIAAKDVLISVKEAEIARLNALMQK
jgi:hypothetical protein